MAAHTGLRERDSIVIAYTGIPPELVIFVSFGRRKDHHVNFLSRQGSVIMRISSGCIHSVINSLILKKYLIIILSRKINIPVEPSECATTAPCQQGISVSAGIFH